MLMKIRLACQRSRHWRLPNSSRSWIIQLVFKARCVMYIHMTEESEGELEEGPLLRKDDLLPIIFNRLTDGQLLEVLQFLFAIDALKNPRQVSKRARRRLAQTSTKVHLTISAIMDKGLDERMSMLKSLLSARKPKLSQPRDVPWETAIGLSAVVFDHFILYYCYYRLVENGGESPAQAFFRAASASIIAPFAGRYISSLRSTVSLVALTVASGAIYYFSVGL